MSNGHVYPEVDKSNADLKYAEHKYLYRNLQNGRFEEVTDKGGPGILENAPARGCAFGDYDNDGDIDVAVNCVNAIPQLLRCDSTLKRNWIKIKLQGVKSNRSGIGSRVIVIAKTKPDAEKALSQMDELRSGGSYFSQNDLRMHFGLDQATKVDMVEIRWLSGQVDQLKDLEVNQLVRDPGRRQDFEERGVRGRGQTAVLIGLCETYGSFCCSPSPCPQPVRAVPG